jgi:hypothetical protein
MAPKRAELAVREVPAVTTLPLAIDELLRADDLLRVVSLDGSLVRMATNELAHLLEVLATFLRAEAPLARIDLRSERDDDALRIELTRRGPLVRSEGDAAGTSQLAVLSLWVARQLVERAGGVLFMPGAEAAGSVELVLPRIDSD